MNRRGGYGRTWRLCEKGLCAGNIDSDCSLKKSVTTCSIPTARPVSNCCMAVLLLVVGGGVVDAAEW